MARDRRLWVEIHRPRDLSEYVWVNDAQRAQVEGWVRDKTIPSMILSGSPGTGKCLGADEKITIRVDRSKLTAQQLAYLDNLSDD